MTLGTHFDASSRALQSAAETATVRLLPDLTDLLDRVRTYPLALIGSTAQATASPAGAAAVLRTAARHTLDQLAGLAATTEDAPASPIRHAVEQLAVTRDVLVSHRGPTGQPVTPYAALLTDARARAHVLGRVAEVTRQAATVLGTMSSTAAPQEAAALLTARQTLLHGTFPADAPATAPLPGMDALPAAPPLIPDDLRPDTGRTVDGIGSACDRLTRAAFEAGRGSEPLSGADTQQIIRSLALAHLLAGRVLLHIAEGQPPALAAHLHDGATALRTASRSWQEVARGWDRIVDVRDPRGHPRLPRYAPDVVRAGHAGPMPRTAPHPATIDAHATALRLGQLLFGEDWHPQAGVRPQSRPREDVLTDAGGAGPLLECLYRLPALGQQFAHAMPHVIGGSRAYLVTDQVEDRPAGLEPQQRFFPAPSFRLDGITQESHAAEKSAQSACATLTDGAAAHGATSSRAALDDLALRASGRSRQGVRTPVRYDTAEPYLSAAQQRAGAHQVARAFTHWSESEMGKSSVLSRHSAVLAFRSAWSALPLTTEESARTAAPYYRQVAETAAGVVGAVAWTRKFSTQDLHLLSQVSDRAQEHMVRLTATFGPAPQAPAGPGAAVAHQRTTPPVRSRGGRGLGA